MKVTIVIVAIVSLFSTVQALPVASEMALTTYAPTGFGSTMLHLAPIMAPSPPLSVLLPRQLRLKQCLDRQNVQTGPGPVSRRHSNCSRIRPYNYDCCSGDSRHRCGRG
ncbi:hypothetical protein BKA67DRAFT_689368 [Truncatella angustata]|uniref:Uncharacterized protein n=1 Tax=Truncatella angustata TaxID=152316 RepID=A0A9P8UU15_9PEZI|nr:uncharacterized protein BKA67DRAFT_689368 [Truncatella angustata]KAH6658194.1 hypothetical protein BKA67DRAFT_689368 [Truncatella angustata]